MFCSLQTSITNNERGFIEVVHKLRVSKLLRVDSQIINIYVALKCTTTYNIYRPIYIYLAPSLLSNLMKGDRIARARCTSLY